MKETRSRKYHDAKCEPSCTVARHFSFIAILFLRKNVIYMNKFRNATAFKHFNTFHSKTIESRTTAIFEKNESISQKHFVNKAGEVLPSRYWIVELSTCLYFLEVHTTLYMVEIQARYIYVFELEWNELRCQLEEAYGCCSSNECCVSVLK